MNNMKTEKYYRKLLSLDRKYLWHPYTQMKDYKERYHILIKRAKGLKLYDYSGKYYYDTISSWWCNILGHNIPEIRNAVNKQLKNLEHTLFAGFTNEPAILLSKILADITHKNLTKVFYSDNGSTAVEVALKISFQYWKNKGINTKEKFIFLENGYHGDTIGAMSVSGVSQFNNVFKPLFFKSYSIPSPYCYRCPYKKEPLKCNLECLEPLRKLLRKKSNEISGIVLEPLIQGAGGMIIYPAKYLDKLYTIVKKHKIHIILDEIATGFGRTGKLFAYEYSKIKPDFLCVSKALTNGTLPLSATLTSKRIYDAFYDNYKKGKTLFHGHTFTGNPIATTIAVTTLNIILKNNLIKKSQENIHYLHKKVKEYFLNSDFIGDIRMQGFVVALEFVKNKEKKIPFDAEERIGWKIYLEGLKNNLLLRPLGNVIYFYLPLTITKKEIDDILSKTVTTIRKVFTHRNT